MEIILTINSEDFQRGEILEITGSLHNFGPSKYDVVFTIKDEDGNICDMGELPLNENRVFNKQIKLIGDNFSKDGSYFVRAKCATAILLNERTFRIHSKSED